MGSSLIEAARTAQDNAHAPYSGYPVGAALEADDGRVFVGANVENASYSLTNCAERTAVFKAVSEGEREFKALALVTSNAGSPCGACRQVLREFAPNLTVYIADAQGNYRQTSIAALLPDSFGPEHLD